LTASPVTVSDYYWALYHYVLPHLGHYRVRELTPRHIAEFQNALIADNMSKGTVRHARTPLSAALKHAVLCSIIRANPCPVVPRPSRDNKPGRTKTSLTLEEAQRLLNAASQADATMWAFIVFGVCRGARRSEILGLRWGDIDAEATAIQIRRRLREERTRSSDGVYLMQLRAGTPKTPKSQRDLSLRGVVGTAVKALRADQAKRRLAAGTDWVDSGYLFTNAVGNPLRPANMYRRYKKLLADNDLPGISFHDLRRTWATLSQEADIRIEQAQEALGHSRIETTKNIYVDAVPALAQRAFDAFDEYLDAPRRPATRRTRNTEET
ncbi:MAG: tyrosine-type recombinase/integrase, partial [Actinomycetota bacterium]|nr:tyrosine-type recombinase/integrase [Actinomycetota bacterium]